MLPTILSPPCGCHHLRDTGTKPSQPCVHRAGCHLVDGKQEGPPHQTLSMRRSANFAEQSGKEFAFVLLKLREELGERTGCLLQMIVNVFKHPRWEGVSEEVEGWRRAHQ